MLGDPDSARPAGRNHQGGNVSGTRTAQSPQPAVVCCRLPQNITHIYHVCSHPGTSRREVIPPLVAPPSPHLPLISLIHPPLPLTLSFSIYLDIYFLKRGPPPLFATPPLNTVDYAPIVKSELASSNRLFGLMWCKFGHEAPHNLREASPPSPQGGRLASSRTAALHRVGPGNGKIRP
jgi:hypothetical protein